VRRQKGGRVYYAKQKKKEEHHGLEGEKRGGNRLTQGDIIKLIFPLFVRRRLGLSARGGGGGGSWKRGRKSERRDLSEP